MAWQVRVCQAHRMSIGLWRQAGKSWVAISSRTAVTAACANNRSVARAVSRVQPIFGGTSEIMKTIIAHDLTGLRA